MSSMSLVQHVLDSRGVATLSLNRPEKLNALSRALCDEYLTALDVVENSISKNEVKVVVLDSSSEKAFCAGADLKEREGMNEGQIDKQLKIQRTMMDRTAALMVPTLAVLRGVAFGGGLELALSCDMRVAASSAAMGLTETRLAIIPGSGGTQRLLRLVGESKAKEMIFLAQRVSAARALEMGLVSRAGDDVSALRDETLNTLLAAGPLALRAAKLALSRGSELPLASALDFERECYEIVLKSRDRVEGLSAFLAKRSPTYRGN